METWSSSIKNIGPNLVGSNFAFNQIYAMPNADVFGAHLHSLHKDCACCAPAVRPIDAELMEGKQTC